MTGKQNTPNKKGDLKKVSGGKADNLSTVNPSQSLSGLNKMKPTGPSTSGLQSGPQASINRQKPGSSSSLK